MREGNKFHQLALSKNHNALHSSIKEEAVAVILFRRKQFASDLYRMGNYDLLLLLLFRQEINLMS